MKELEKDAQAGIDDEKEEEEGELPDIDNLLEESAPP
jgi:hypothetical protein